MPQSTSWRAIPIAIIASLCALALAGCASWQGPRIDPTGERLILWPDEPAPVVAAPPTFAPTIAPPPGAPVVAPSVGAPVATAPVAIAPPPVTPVPFGNVQAPPVYSDPTSGIVEPTVATEIPPAPIFPSMAAPSLPAAPAVPGTFAPTMGVANVAPSGPIYVPGPIAPITTAAYGSEAVRVSPDRLIVPVGTEVVLKAGVFGPDCQLTPNRRIDWSIAPTGVGQFTEMGIRDRSQLLGFWEAPQRIDGWNAIGRTAFVPVTLNANTANPADDVQIFRGESWVTMTSMCEGTSSVTASANTWCDASQACATIFWIDAQWIYPQSVNVPCGQPHTLTSTVSRRTDGAPLAGWVVRYTVASGASLGYEGGNTIDVPTDATGRASVEVSPMAQGAGTTNVFITIVRPASANGLPRMEIGRGAAAIAWSAAATSPATIAPGPTPLPSPPSGPIGPGAGPAPSTFTPPSSSASPSTFAPPPSQPMAQPSSPPPANTTQPSPYSATPPSQPVGQPRLDVSLKLVTAPQVAVNENAGWDLTITNVGNAIAPNVKVADRFDRGLRHIAAENQNVVYKNDVGSLQPGQSTTVHLDFTVVEAGQQCHEVTVSADGADPVVKRDCVTGIAPALGVKITGERSKTVGETTDFSVVVRNTGASPATNIELVVQFDPAMEGVVEDAWQRMQDGGLLMRLDRGLAPSEVRQFRVHARCKSPSNSACAKLTATAAGGANAFDQDCHLEIRPALPAAGPNGTMPQ